MVSILTAAVLMAVLTACGANAFSGADGKEYANSMELVKDMGIGWNLGNTLDPVDCTWLKNESDYETAWGNPKTTRELISFVKEQGFDTIRLPVTWKNHIGDAPDYKISEAWLARVDEVVDWCMEEDLFVIINMHHEGSWLQNASKDYESTMEQYRAVWTQLAEHYGDRSEKLIFESMNEIGFDDLGTDKGCELMNRINAEFTDIVRNSGKKNAARYLLLASYWTDIDRSCGRIVLPDDDRVILSVHYYSPSDFAIAEKGTEWGYRETWGTDADKEYMNGQFEKLKESFLDRGIPVIIGEFGCTVKDKEAKSRLDYLSSVVKYSKEYGICPVLWDSGEIIDRTALSWKQSGDKEAVLAAAG